MDRRSQVATTAIAILLALLAAGLIVGVSPTGIGQTITVYPGSDTKIVNTITVADGMLINITNSTCIITDPAYATTVISPMTAEGSGVFSPYSNCLPLGLDLGYITDVKMNLTIGTPDSNGFNQSIFEIENGLLRFYFSSADTMRVFINETGNFTLLLRLGWVSAFISSQQWDNRTDARFIDEGNTKKIQINFSTPDGYLIHNVSMSDYSPTIGFEYKWYDANPAKNSSMYPSWYPERFYNYSHPNYVWPQVVRFFDSIRLMATDEVFSANQSVGFCNAEIWDSKGSKTNFTITVDNACGAVWNTTESYDNTIETFELIHLEDPYIDLNSTDNPTHSYGFTIIPDQTQTCIGAGTFNMTCSFVPVREGNHTVDMYMEYYYVNQTGGPNATESLTKSDWFWVESAPLPGCDTGPTCDIACDWLLGHTCDCDEECASGFCFNGVCSAPAPPPIIPPVTLEANISYSAPESVKLYVNETTQFRIDIENVGGLPLGDVELGYVPAVSQVSIVPPNYPIIDVAEKRAFLVSAKPRELINETVTFFIDSNETDRMYFDVIFYAFPTPPIYNASYLYSQLDMNEELWNDTREILAFLKDGGYEITALTVQLQSITDEFSEIEQLIQAGDYKLARDRILQISEQMEAIYLGMQFIQTVAEIDPTVLHIFAVILGLSVAVLFLLVFVRRPTPVRLALIFANINVIFTTIIFFIFGVVDLRFLFVGSVLGVTIFMSTKSYLGIKRTFFKGKETFRVFIFTILYFVISSAALVGIISVSGTFNELIIAPLQILTGTYPPYVSGYIEFVRFLEPPNMAVMNSEFLMRIQVTSLDVSNGTFVDYFPKDFILLDSGGGIISSFNERYNQIAWNISIPTIINYTLFAPNQEGVYYFGRARIGPYFETKAYEVFVYDLFGTVIDTGMEINDSEFFGGNLFTVKLYLKQTDSPNKQGQFSLRLRSGVDNGTLDQAVDIIDTACGSNPFRIVGINISLCEPFECSAVGNRLDINYSNMNVSEASVTWVLQACQEKVGTYDIDVAADVLSGDVNLKYFLENIRIMSFYERETVQSPAEIGEWVRWVRTFHVPSDLDTFEISEYIPGDALIDSIEVSALNQTTNIWVVEYRTLSPELVSIWSDSLGDMWREKVVVVSSASVHYTNVKSYIDIPENYLGGNHDFRLFDSEYNDITDDSDNSMYIEDGRLFWTVPLLSEVYFYLGADPIREMEFSEVRVVGGDDNDVNLDYLSSDDGTYLRAGWANLSGTGQLSLETDYNTALVPNQISALESGISFCVSSENNCGNPTSCDEMELKTYFWNRNTATWQNMSETQGSSSEKWELTATKSNELVDYDLFKVKYILDISGCDGPVYMLVDHATANASYLTSALSIPEVSIQPESRYVGAEIDLSCEVLNVGDVDLSGIEVTPNIIKPDGAKTIWSPKETKYVSLLKPGQRATLSWNDIRTSGFDFGIYTAEISARTEYDEMDITADNQSSLELLGWYSFVTELGAPKYNIEISPPATFEAETLTVTISPPNKIYLDDLGRLLTYFTEMKSPLEEEILRKQNTVAVIMEVIDNPSQTTKNTFQSRINAWQEDFWDPEYTSRALIDMCAANKRPIYGITTNMSLIQSGLEHLVQTQANGTWSDMSIQDSILNILALQICDADRNAISDGVNWLTSTQNLDGSWNGTSENSQFLTTGYGMLVLEGAIEEGLLFDEGPLSEAYLWIANKTAEDNIFFKSAGIAFLVHVAYYPYFIEQNALQVAAQIPADLNELHYSILLPITWGLGLYSKTEPPIQMTLSKEDGKFILNIDPEAYGVYTIQFYNETVNVITKPKIPWH